MDMMLPVDTAVTVPVNAVALIDDNDFKTREESVSYNASGLDLVWNFMTPAGVITQTAVTPTNTGGDYDWTNVGNGDYKIEIPASGGASINNDTEGWGWFSGVATGILPWRGPTLAFVPAHVINGLVTGTDNLQVDTVQVEGSDATDQINAACDASIETYKLDHLVAVADADDPVDNSIIAKIVASDGDWSGFDNTTDSLEALKNSRQSDVTAGLTTYDAATGTDISGLNDPTAAAIADAVWEEAIADHSGTAGSTAEALDGASAPSAASIADAVWDEATAGHTTAGTFGEQLKTDVDAILTDTAEIGAAGAGLSAVPWNAAWDAEVQSEVNDGLVAYDAATGTDISGLNDPTAAAIADAVWEEAIADHSATVGSTAEALDGASAPTAGEVADAVWEEAIADHSGTAGSTAESLNAAGGAGDPWTTTLPGSYTGSQAGKMLSDVLTDTAVIGAAGAGLTEAGGTGDHLTAVPWNAAWDAEVQSEVADGLNAYDPPTRTEATSDKAEILTRLGTPDGASVSADIATIDSNVDTLVSRITSTLFSGITSMAEWLGLLSGKQTGNSTARTELRATGAGSGTYDETTDSLEAQKDAAGAGDASLANQTTIINHLTDIKGGTWSSGTDTLEEIRDAVDGISVGTGAGAFPVTLIVKLSDETLVPECDVVLTTTSTAINTNVSNSGRSDANGSITFNLDAGTYYVWRQKAAYNFPTTPATLTVAADGSYTVT